MDNSTIKKMSADLAVKLMHEFDLNGDSKIDKIEFKNMMNSIITSWNKAVPGDYPDGFQIDGEALQEAFDSTDGDKNGEIDFKELKETLEGYLHNARIIL